MIRAASLTGPETNSGCPCPAGGDDLGGELPGQHRGLELQQAVQDPEQSQHDLDPPPRDLNPGQTVQPSRLTSSLARREHAACHHGEVLTS
jgi:hypothetical protein